MSEARWFDEELFESGVQCVVPLDYHRRRFVRDVAVTMTMMARPEGLKSNRFRKMLISTNKNEGTLLLASIMYAAAKAAVGGWVIPCYLDSTAPGARPTDAIRKSLPLKLRLVLPLYRIKHRMKSEMWILNELLRDYGLVMFMVVDNFECMYKSGSDHSIDELNELGGFPGNAIQCILGGDSSLIQELAFCELDPALMPLYPKYDPALDLNRTKYEMVWIEPKTFFEDPKKRIY